MRRLRALQKRRETVQRNAFEASFAPFAHALAHIAAMKGAKDIDVQDFMPHFAGHGTAKDPGMAVYEALGKVAKHGKK